MIQTKHTPSLVLLTLVWAAGPLPVAAADLVVDGASLTLNADTVLDGEVVIQNGGVLTLVGISCPC